MRKKWTPVEEDYFNSLCDRFQKNFAAMEREWRENPPQIAPGLFAAPRTKLQVFSSPSL
jgi:hypothetical protein